MKRFEIWWCDLSDVIGSEQGGQRPVMIIQNDVGNKHSPTTIVASLTKQLTKAKIPTHIYLPKEIGIKNNSLVLLEQIRTVDKIRMIHKICDLPDKYKERCDKALKISVGIME